MGACTPASWLSAVAAALPFSLPPRNTHHVPLPRELQTQGSAPPHTHGARCSQMPWALHGLFLTQLKVNNPGRGLSAPGRAPSGVGTLRPPPSGRWEAACPASRPQ